MNNLDYIRELFPTIVVNSSNTPVNIMRILLNNLGIDIDTKIVFDRGVKHEGEHHIYNDLDTGYDKHNLSERDILVSLPYVSKKFLSTDKCIDARALLIIRLVEHSVEEVQEFYSNPLNYKKIEEELHLIL